MIPSRRGKAMIILIAIAAMFVSWLQSNASAQVGSGVDPAKMRNGTRDKTVP